VAKLAANGECSQYDWEPLRNFLIDLVRETLEKFQVKYKDSNTFEEEQEIILQYLVFFSKLGFN
jgi:hypothetical protein